MFRSSALSVLILALAGCMTPSDDGHGAGIADTRITFASPDPEGGPIIFEFYADGTGLLVFDEVAERGQTPLNWRVEGAQVCLSSQERPRDECSAFTLIGTTLTLVDVDDMVGTVTPL
ncbi:hypothetical protein [Octadecabacter ascidiaceicola]|uniref:Lipoprotein n=1 Tax=Octadecabacter ascidiaceicola TaxID=1655543 RepID=A0A238JSJ6_9RHOB|nr:hypothetical protein [Octadecabacter ascidiaceicola]SMX33443.1 hypothetical protein OCA8868_00954 [Octadecabacter ascidiaceicola]